MTGQIRLMQLHCDLNIPVLMGYLAVWSVESGNRLVM